MPESSAHCRHLREFMSYLLPEGKHAVLPVQNWHSFAIRVLILESNSGLARTTIGMETQIIWHIVDAFHRGIVSNRDK